MHVVFDDDRLFPGLGPYHRCPAALGLLHLLRSQARFATEEEFTLAAVIDAIVELEAADIVPVPWEGDEIDQSGLELLAAALQLVEDAGDVSLADASVFLREACRLQGQL